MSKLWLLLLAVAAFQAVHSYPAHETDYLEDAEQSTWSILKDTFGKLKDLYTEKGKQALEKLTEKLKEKLCNQQDLEDFDFEEDEEPSLQIQVVQKLRELLKKLQAAKDAEKARIQRQINALRTKICDKLNQQDFEEDKADTTAAIIKDTWSKLKDLWKSKGEQVKGKAKDALQKLIAKLKDTLCKQKDFIELDYEEDDAKDPVKVKLMQKIKELQQKIKKVTEEKKLELLQRIEELRAKLCDKLSDAEDTDDGDDEERINWGKIGKGILKGAKKAWKKMKPALKSAVKKGAKLLKKNAIKVTPFECEEKSCKTCINLVFLGLSACLKATITRTNKNTYFTISGEVNGNTQFEEKIRLGDLPRCVNAGSVIGKLCLKGMEGKGKSSQGKANVNFCLGFLAEKHNVGVKVCATYENKKFKIKVSPQLFAGGLDDSGDIVVGNDKDESQGVSLAADEFEIE
uniref:Venom redulysin protein 7 n=1 Tax=Pristhesancus plagipennis TaxID=1955184 RepID=A0A1Q1NPG0_PRIPG|nr:venom redulysin protein 7 [Pristhesancus plagipennis]